MCPNRRSMPLALVVIVAIAAAGRAPAQEGESETPSFSHDPLPIKLAVDDRNPDAYLVLTDDGRYAYRVRTADGGWETVDPDAFADRTFHRQRGHGLLAALMNTTEPFGFLWVLMGLTGQVVFTGRMLLQWIASERSRRSVVPVAFWWMSLIGASMLLTYFIWRRDIVGVLGQGAGWLIYLRNLYLIYRPHRPRDHEETPVVG